MSRVTRLTVTATACVLSLAVAAFDVLATGGHGSPTPKPSATPTPKPTKTPTPTPKPTKTPSPTATPTKTPTPTPKPTKTPSPTATPAKTPTPKPTKTPSPTATPTKTPSPTATPTPKATSTAAPTPKPTPTLAPTAVATAVATPVSVCHHNCPDKLRWGKNGKPDQLTIRSAFPFDAEILESDSLSISLRDAAGTIYSASLQAGDLVRRGKSLQFNDRNAKKGTGFRGGLAKVKIQDVPKGKGVRVTIEAYGDFSAADDPTMTLRLRVGPHVNQITDYWEETAFGWYRFHN